MKNIKIKPEVLFESSWEVCNKIGGVHTVLSSKARQLSKQMKDYYILIGPDVYRDSDQHPEFIEDRELFAEWRESAWNEGLPVRVGRWNIDGKPVVFLVDFTPFIGEKDKILSQFWEDYKLDSLSGQWDYIEPVLFGYASGRVIESFSNFYFTPQTSLVAQFHEWLSGAAILYLKKKAPQIATIFTAHATLLGRNIAANDYPIYEKLESYDPLEMARRFNIVAKNSLETLSAQNADIFTCVSNMTAKECKHFLKREVDLITPNGFWPVDKPEVIQEFRKTSREKLIRVASALTGQSYDDDVFIIGTVARYEFKNKGIDVFIDALGKLNKQNDGKKIIAYLMVPGANYGPDENVLASIEGKASGLPANFHVTHELHDPENDPVLNLLKSRDLMNQPDSRVSIVFVPSYINGHDGILNLKYYELISGFDLTVFASYYEPWGYTPLESISYSVPSVTTNLAGFGRWVKDSGVACNGGLKILNRTDNNHDEVVDEIAAHILDFSQKDLKQLNEARNNAISLAKTAFWPELIINYQEAYSAALALAFERKEKLDISHEPINEYSYKAPVKISPVWHETSVKSVLPRRLEKLGTLSKNLWWSWNYDAVELFERIEPELWRKSRYNPVVYLEMISAAKFNLLEKDESFLQHYDRVTKDFESYMNTGFIHPENSLAYFSMEYGFHDSLKIFSGGLGILAGDYLKEASDSRVNMTGIGLLYRMGYFRQQISIKGDQLAEYPIQDFMKIPVVPVYEENGDVLKVSVVFPGRTVYARVWQVNIGRIKLYLLDTDGDENREADRDITHALYGGDNEHRFKQEMILGIGGIRVLEKLGIEPELYHINEGHAAFIGLERLRKYIYDENKTFAEAKEIVRASSLFTTHTPVPAGHDAFHEDLVRTYMAHYPQRLRITWEDFLSLGKLDINDKNELFSMSHLAVNLSQEVNGVSWLHGEVSKDMFAPMFPGYYPEESHISYVTNGVHYQSWAAKEWQILYKKTFGKDFLSAQEDTNHWGKIHQVDDAVVWKTHLNQKKALVDYLKARIERNWISRHEDPKKIMAAINALNEESLIIGFARRFATYKRAHLLFSNLERLEKIVNDSEKPVMFFFAGKAHPRDIPGQELIKKVVEISRLPQFVGKIIFLENYDIELAKRLVQGVDIWMNTPTRPLEASGTSGMKAVMNGALHFSVLDGWWVEGYEKNAGWALPLERTYEEQDLQNQLDAELIYNILEQEIIPDYYQRNRNLIPEKWVSYMKNSIARVAPKFTMRRMIIDYQERFYNKEFERYGKIKKNNFELARNMSVWKNKIRANWENIKVIDYRLPGSGNKEIQIGSEYPLYIKLNTDVLSAEEIGVELVSAEKNSSGKYKIISKQEFTLEKAEGKLARYSLSFKANKPGSISYGIRIFPKHEHMPHRQDLPLVKWI